MSEGVGLSVPPLSKEGAVGVLEKGETCLKLAMTKLDEECSHLCDLYLQFYKSFPDECSLFCKWSSEEF